MYLVYVDETGIDGVAPVVIMTGIVVNDEKLSKTQRELEKILERVAAAAGGPLRELKSADLLLGQGRFRKMDNDVRCNVIENLCAWLTDRSHQLALSAIDIAALSASSPPGWEVADPWMAAAAHMALQLQRAHGGKTGSKGRTALIFDNNPKGLAKLAEFVNSPPAWSDEYYGRGPRQRALNQLIDTPFAVQSHHVGLVQVADVFAAIFRYHVELADFGQPERYPGQRGHVESWVSLLAPRLLPRAARWPTKTPSKAASWFTSLAPASLLSLR